MQLCVLRPVLMCSSVSSWRSRKVTTGWLLTLYPRGSWRERNRHNKAQLFLPGKKWCWLWRRRGESAAASEEVLEGFILVMVIGLLVWKWDHSRKPHSVSLPHIYLSGRLQGERGEGWGDGVGWGGERGVKGVLPQRCFHTKAEEKWLSEGSIWCLLKIKDTFSASRQSLSTCPFVLNAFYFCPCV